MKESEAPPAVWRRSKAVSFTDGCVESGEAADVGNFNVQVHVNVCLYTYVYVCF